MTALEKPGHVSVEDYLDGEELGPVKHEYIAGAIHAMAGATNRHNTIALNCLAFLHSHLRGKPCQAFNSDTKVRLHFADHTRFYYPDAMAVCEPNPDTDRFQDRPSLLVEVLSESTRRIDLYEKRDAYLTLPSLQTLLLIESNEPLVHVHRRGPDGFLTETVHGLASSVALGPALDVPLPLAEIYDRVSF